jgi:LysM repeat protein
MKILKIFGVVVGIHVFALILIFANPGCSSTTKSIPAPSDTVSRVDTGPSVSLPMSSSSVSVPVDGMSPSPAFNPDAPALPAGSSVRFTPTRPGTAAASTLIIEPVVDVTPATTYTVTTGDNLWSLSKKFHVSTGEIATANSLKTNAILRPGQKLLIPGKAATPTMAATVSPASVTPKATEPAAARPAGETIKHVVKAGESLSAIASQYGVRQGEIAAANNIADPQRIRAGMELTIPGWQSTSKSGNGARPAAKAPAPKAEVPPIFSSGPAATEAPKPAAAEVPIIRVDDSPIAPATKTP